MKVSVIGAGAVGKATGAGLSRIGHEVIFYDIDRNRLRELKAEGLNVTESLNEASVCDVHMISVPTPVPGGTMDFTIVESALTALAKAMTQHNEYQVVAIRSTVVPFTTRNRLIPLLERYCPLTLGKHYGVCHNPEFLREVHALDDFLDPPINVIGTNDEQSASIMRQLYATFDAPLLVTNLENAEAIKIFSNVYNAGKVSFFNEMYIIAERLGLDHNVISQALTKSSLGVRVPEYYTRGGSPFGGKCLPKDLAAFITFLRERKLSTGLFDEVARINEVMKRLEVEKK